MKKAILLIVLLFIGSSNLNSQVGIGVATPNANSILDLTNTNSKGLLLPILSSAPTSTTGPEGMMFYYDSLLYVRDGVGFNGITPWRYKYNGSTNEVVYFNPASYIGVGIGVDDAAVKGNIHIAQSGKEVAMSGTSASIFVGDSDSGSHLLIDNDEIMVKSNPTSSGTLKLQEGGGTVQVGQDIVTTSTLNVFGKVKENGNDLVPQGVIVMWSGTTSNVPAGWALCDGQKYSINTTTGATEVNASGVQTPNLSGRFIVAAGSNGTSTYTPGNTGGQDNVVLTTANLPNHVHTGTTNSDGSHSHTYYDKTVSREDVNGSNFDNQGINGVPDNARTTDAAGAHTHSFSTSGCSGCTATSINNRPIYYSLAYIMKL